LTIGLSREVATEGIRVNAVRVGLVDTELHARSGQPNRVQNAISKVPMGRPADASEVAAAILWLASDEASFVTGAILDVAGGG
jgi:NAD(P)-dependent dehydrogenase (short-subunit alcohol dehydrogenase family)